MTPQAPIKTGIDRNPQRRSAEYVWPLRGDDGRTFAERKAQEGLAPCR